MKKKIFLLTLVFLSACSMVFGQQISTQAEASSTIIVPEVQSDTAPPTSGKPRIDIGAGYWYTWASLDTTLVAIETLPGYYLKGDKISELNYKTDAGLFVINADAFICWRIYADALVALGNMHNANQLDSDWLMSISNLKWMESKAEADGDVLTWDANLYFRILQEKEDKGFFDVSLGYLYYKDDITKMKDLVYRIVDWAATNEPVAGLDSSDRYKFDGVRLGARAKIRFCERVAFKINGGLAPWMKSTRDGYWNLRSMDISGDADASGFDINASLEFKITKNFFAELGYRYMSFDTDVGDYTHKIEGGVYNYEKGWDSTEVSRGGIYAMGRLKI